MTASIHLFKPRDNPSGRLANLHGCPILRFPKEARRPDSFAAHLNYMDAWTLLNCQAALVVASSVALYFKAFGVSSVHHVHQHERGASTCRTERQGQNLAPDEGQ